MGRPLTGRPVGRTARDYSLPAPPIRMQKRCPRCRTHNLVCVDTALTNLVKAHQACGNCGAILWNPQPLAKRGS